MLIPRAATQTVLEGDHYYRRVATVVLLPSAQNEARPLPWTAEKGAIRWRSLRRAPYDGGPVLGLLTRAVYDEDDGASARARPRLPPAPLTGVAGAQALKPRDYAWQNNDLVASFNAQAAAVLGRRGTRPHSERKQRSNKATRSAPRAEN